MTTRRDFLRQGLISAAGVSLLGGKGVDAELIQIPRADAAQKVTVPEARPG
jgi:hypothetical protein